MCAARSDNARKSIASTTLSQIFFFGVYLASTILCVNNVLDLSYRWGMLVDTKDLLQCSDKFLQVIASIGLMYFSMSSPFEQDQVFHISVSGKHAALSRTFYFAALLYTCLSEIVEDPNVLFSEFRTLVMSVSNETSELLGTNGTSAIDRAFDLVQVNTFGQDWIHLMFFAKVYCFIAALVCAIAVILSDLPDLSKKTLQNIEETWPARTIELVLVALNAHALYLLQVAQSSALSIGSLKESHRRLRQLASIGYTSTIDLSQGIYLDTNWTDYLDSAIGSPTQTIVDNFLSLDGETMHMVSACLMLLVASYISFFYLHHTHSLPLIVFVSWHNIVQVEGIIGQDETFYTIFLPLVICAAISLLAQIVCNLRLSSFLTLIPNLFYKTGLILCVLSLPIIIVGWTHPWVEVTLTPVDLSSRAISRLQDVDSRIDSLYDNLADHVRKLNPCMTSFSLDIDLQIDEDLNFDDKVEQATEQVDEALIEQRQENAKHGVIFNLQDCIENEYPFEWKIDQIRGRPFKRYACKRMKRRENGMRESILEDLVEEMVANQASGVSSSTFDFETEGFYVDKFCTNIKCATITAIMAALTVLVKIPFVGNVVSVLKDVVQVGYKIWRFGLRLIRKLPTLIAKRKKLRKLKKRLKLLVMSQTKRTITPSQSLLWTFFPVLLAAGVALTLIMIRRQTVYESQSHHASRFLVGLKMAIGIALPLLFAEVVVLLVMTYYPSMLQEVLDLLPGWLVSAQVELDIGFQAMKTGYLVSILGNLCLVIAGFTQIENSVLLIVLQATRAIVVRLFSFVYNHTRYGLSNINRYARKLEVSEPRYEQVQTSENRSNLNSKHDRKQYTSTPIIVSNPLLVAQRSTKQNKATAKTAIHASAHVEQRLNRFQRVVMNMVEFVLLKLGYLHDYGELSWVRIEDTVYTLLDWKIQYLQPLLFSLIPIPIIVINTIDQTYATLSFTQKQDVMMLAQELSASTTTFNGMLDVEDEFQDLNCGWVEKVAELTINALRKTLSASIIPFKLAFSAFSESTQDLRNKLDDFIYAPAIVVPDLFEQNNLTLILLFGIPIMCTAVLLIMWILSLICSISYRFHFVRKFLRLDKENLDSFMAIFATFLLSISITMIVVHIIIGTMLQTLQDVDIPYFEFRVTLGWKYYLVIVAHCCNAMSAIAHYVNIMLPPINY